MTIVRLSYDQILEMHEALLTAYGGQSGIRDEERVRSALESPFQEFFGQEAYPSIALKGAVMCYELAEGQGFIDGNKRIAFHSAMVFFALNGGKLMTQQLDIDAMDEYMRSLSERSYEELAAWFRGFIDDI